MISLKCLTDSRSSTSGEAFTTRITNKQQHSDNSVQEIVCALMDDQDGGFIYCRCSLHNMVLGATAAGVEHTGFNERSRPRHERRMKSASHS